MNETASAKPTPFVWQERRAQTKRTVTYISRLIKNPKLKQYFETDIEIDIEIPGKIVAEILIMGAIGSMNSVDGCSHCGKKIIRGSWRIEIFCLHAGKSPVAFQFGERFCSNECGTRFASIFIRFGIPHQNLGKKPQKCLISLELNTTINPILN